MKIFAIFAIFLLAGCTSGHWNTPQESQARWNDMQTDLLLMNKYKMKSGCGCMTHGYSKE